MQELFIINENLIIVSINQDLFLQGKNGCYNISTGDYSLYLLPLLEYNKCSFWDKINARYDFPNKINDVINKLVKYPFDHKMEYWSFLSLNWIDPNNIDISWVKSIKREWMSQNLRNCFNKAFNIGNLLGNIR